MRGLMCSTTARTNEEFKEVIKGRIHKFTLLAFVGILTISMAVFTRFYLDRIKDNIFCLYTGLGFGLLFGSAILLIKNRGLLRDEEKLKESRLENADERIREISNRAFRVSALVMIFIMYAIALIGGIFYPVLLQVLLALVSIFLITYTLTYRFYDKKM